MKRIAVLFVLAFVAAGAAYFHYPGESARIADLISTAVTRSWESVEGNPTPLVLAFSTFALTVAYYKAKGKSLRESVEVAATRVTVIPVSTPPAEESENSVLRRAKARAWRTQLLADRIGLENRQRKWPEEVSRAEKETCYTEQALVEARRTLEARQKAHDAAIAKLKELRKHKAQGDAELADIDAELKKLAELI